MSAPDFPAAMTEEAVAKMLYDDAPKCVLYEWRHAKAHARAVLALCEAKVREAVKATDPQDRMMQDEIVARVMGKEAPK